jgi:hypothetical protein
LSAPPLRVPVREQASSRGGVSRSEGVKQVSADAGWERQWGAVLGAGVHADTYADTPRRPQVSVAPQVSVFALLYQYSK